MSSDALPQERWGADTLPRDPNLPTYIDHDLLDDEESTLPPEGEERTLRPEEDATPSTNEPEAER